MAAKAAAIAACCALVLLFVRGVARSLSVRRSAAESAEGGRPLTGLPPSFRPRASPSKASPPSGRAAPATLPDRIRAAGSAHSTPVRERSASPLRYALPQTEWSTGTENFTGISLIA